MRIWIERRGIHGYECSRPSMLMWSAALSQELHGALELVVVVVEGPEDGGVSTTPVMRFSLVGTRAFSSSNPMFYQKLADARKQTPLVR